MSKLSNVDLPELYKHRRRDSSADTCKDIEDIEDFELDLADEETTEDDNDGEKDNCDDEPDNCKSARGSEFLQSPDLAYCSHCSVDCSLEEGHAGEL